MNAADEINGFLRLGRGFGGSGIPVSIKQNRDAPDRGLRPGQDIGRGAQGETTNLLDVGIEIRILAGRDGNKYAWEQVHPHPTDTGVDPWSGSTEDGFFALEINERIDVEAGTIVFARPSPIGPWLNFSSGGGGASVSLVRPTASEPNSYGNWPAVLWVPDGDSGYEDGDEVRLTFDHWPEQSTLERLFVENQIEIGFLNGSVTEGETTFSLYHAQGVRQSTVPMCDGEDEIEECWRIPGWARLDDACTVVTPAMQFNQERNSQYSIAPSPMRI